MARLESGGVPAFVIGGYACMLYDAQKATKDCDVLLLEKNTDVILDILSGENVEGHPFTFSKQTCPLDTRWLEGGYWSNLFTRDPAMTAAEVGTSQVPPLACLDFFGKDPVMDLELVPDEIPQVVSRNTVAYMKRTNRPRDWEVIEDLGYNKMYRGQKNKLGLLHIYDPQTLEQLTSMLPDDSDFAQLCSVRPLLRLFKEKNPEAQRYLTAERNFWEHMGEMKMAVIGAAADSYFGAMRKVSPLFYKNSLRQQHEIMVERAEKYHLPLRPLDKYPKKMYIDSARKFVIGADFERFKGCNFKELDFNLLPIADFPNDMEVV